MISSSKEAIEWCLGSNASFRIANTRYFVRVTEIEAIEIIRSCNARRILVN